MDIIDIHRHHSDTQNIDETRPYWESLGYRYVCFSGNAQRTRDAIKRHADFVIGFAYLKMDQGPFAWRNARAEAKPMDINEIDRFREEGFRGLKVICTDKPYSHDAYFPYYQRAEQLGLPILFHTGWVSGGIPDYVRRQENFRPVFLQTIAGAFPDLKIIGAHLGGWQFATEAIIAMWKHPNIYFDMCGGTTRTRPTAFFRDLFSLVAPQDPLSQPTLNLDIFGKLVYGTDNEDDRILAFYRKIMHSLEIPHDVQKKIFYSNAAALLQLT